MNFNAANFDYDPVKKLYTAEASTLGLPPGETPGLHITIDGYAFVGTHCDYDASGEDLMGWNYAATGNTVALHAGFAGHRVLIIND